MRAVKTLEELFHYFLKHPDEIGEGAQKRVKKHGLRRAVCDYIAGMTDRYVMLEYERVFGKTPAIVTEKEQNLGPTPYRA
jgi:dGTPase